MSDDATLGLMLAATDPTLGVRLRAGHGPARNPWLARMRPCFPGTPFGRIPASVSDERRLGGIDLAATLQSGRSVMDRGVMAKAAGGVLLTMAERILPGTAARIGGVQDRASCGIVALGGLLEGLNLRPETSSGPCAGASIMARMSLDSTLAGPITSLSGASLPLQGVAAQVFLPQARVLAGLPGLPQVFFWPAERPANKERPTHAFRLVSPAMAS